MSDLPCGWEQVRVGDVARYINGRAFKPDDWEECGRPIIRIQNLSRDDAPFNYTTKEVEERYIVRPGTLLVSWSATLDVYLWHGREAVLNQHIFKVEPNEDIAGERYLRWALANALTEMRASEATHGTTMRHINRGPFLAHPFPLPPLAEQQRIVEALEEQFSRLDAGVASLQRAKRNLARMRASVLAAAVEGRLVQPEGERATVKVGDICEVQGGIQKQPKRAPKKNAYPFLRVANVLRGRLELEDVHQIELFGLEIERLRLRTGDLLVVEGNGSPSQIGRGAIWHGEIEDCVHQNHIIRVRPSEALIPQFLAFTWNSSKIASQLTEVASSTSGLYTLSTAKIKAIRMDVPSIVEQQRIVAEVERQFSILDAMEATVTAALARAERLRQSVLREAFAGRLVPQDPADEPASVLLERIKSERVTA